MIVAPPPWSRFPAVDRTTTSYLLWTMLFRLGGALWAALVLPPLLRKMYWCDHRYIRCTAWPIDPVRVEEDRLWRESLLNPADADISATEVPSPYSPVDEV